VLIIFGVMLTTRMFSVEMKTGTLNILPATIFTAILAGILIFVFSVTDWGVVPDQEFDTTVYGIGTLLVNEFILPMQVAGVLLLVAMIGAVMMAARERSKSQSK